MTLRGAAVLPACRITGNPVSHHLISNITGRNQWHATAAKAARCTGAGQVGAKFKHYATPHST